MIRAVPVVILAAVLAAPSLSAAEAQAGAAAKAPAPAAPASPAPSGPDVVAVVGGQPITLRDFEESAAGPLFQLRNQQFQAQRQILEEDIAKRLLEREATERKVTVDELLQQEVTAKVPAVTPEEQKAYYDENKARIPPMAEAEALQRIATGLSEQRRAQRRAAFIDSLRKKAGVRVLLEPPRLQVAADGSPSRGPAGAPVTIVEFSDFQCPYCSRAIATLKKIEETYAGKVRLVYRDYPLVNIHPAAARAAEAAACADDQGKFWAMHDSLFQGQDKLAEADLKKRAADLGLDTAKFEECLASGRHTADWKKDSEDAERYGISSTPAFFINGRVLVGAQPYEAFARVIDEELVRAGVDLPASSPAAVN
jgi:predicted DsbA family dithiol-disulfide isomerase